MSVPHSQNIPYEKRISKNEVPSSLPSRRKFVVQSAGVVGAAVAATLPISRSAWAAGSDRIKIGLVMDADKQFIGLCLGWNASGSEGCGAGSDEVFVRGRLFSCLIRTEGCRNDLLSAFGKFCPNFGSKFYFRLSGEY